MLVSTKQAYVFQQEIGTNQDGTPIYGDRFRLPLTEAPVVAPDWIKETLLWKLAIEDGTLTVYGSTAAPGSELSLRSREAV